MTTLAYLTRVGKLEKYEPVLGGDEQPVRFTYFAPEAKNWLLNTLAVAPSDRGRDLTPIEEVAVLLRDFALGRPMAYSVDYRKLDPLTQHVWEFKTIDVRLIGWFARRATFVVVCGRLKEEIKRASLYTPCIQHVIWFRDNLELEEPKLINGVNHRDVL